MASGMSTDSNRRNTRSCAVGSPFYTSSDHTLCVGQETAKRSWNIRNASAVTPIHRICTNNAGGTGSMTDSTSDPKTSPVPTISHAGTRFDAHCTAVLAEPGPCILLVGGDRPERQSTFGRILAHTDHNALQFNLQTLLGERRGQTQNGLRKAFDSGAEEQAVLFFDPLDPLLTWTHVDAPDGETDDATPSTVEYFFQRIESYTYPVVLGMADPVYISTVRQAPLHLIVSHGEAMTEANTTTSP